MNKGIQELLLKIYARLFKQSIKNPRIQTNAHVGNGAVGFAKTELNHSFSGGEAKAFLCEEKWICRFGLSYQLVF